MKKNRMKFIGLLLISWSIVVFANTKDWSFRVVHGKQNIVSTEAFVVIDKKNYPVKLTLVCTKDEKPYTEGMLSLNLELPTVVADYFPMDEIEGPDARIVVQAKLETQISKLRSYHALMPTHMWHDESNRIMFGITEPYKAHQQLYQLLRYLANGATNLQITLENPQSDQHNILIKTNPKTSAQTVVKQMMRRCGLQ